MKRTTCESCGETLTNENSNLMSVRGPLEHVHLCFDCVPRAIRAGAMADIVTYGVQA